jgi:hypothetical protein
MCALGAHASSPLFSAAMTAESSRTSRLVRPALVEWIAFAVGLVLCVHYAWILDDAYVYFRYVDNWLFLGRGLVYNPGEFAEGFTSPSWLLLLASARGLGLGYWLAVRGFALVAFAAFWYGAVVLNRRLSPAGAPCSSSPVVFLCLNYSVLSYFSSGVETPLVQLCAVGYALYFVRPSSRLGLFAVAVSPLVRPELDVKK